MKTASLSVSWHSASKQFVKYVGYALGRDGSPKPKSFYLGDDQTTALAMAARLVGDWAALKASGATTWPTTYLDDFQRTSIAGNATVGRLANGLTVDETLKGLTVEQCRIAYLDEQRQRYEAKQVSASWYGGCVRNLRTVLDRLPDNLQISDRPIRTVGARELQSIILHWASCPIGQVGNQSKRETTGSHRRCGHKYVKRPRRTGKPISIAYARDLLAMLKAFLNWCHESERWDRPRRFDKLFKIKGEHRHVEAERFTVDELVKLYRACQSDRHRLWIMLGLNCGLDRMGLATLDWSMVKGLDTDLATIERPRHKTKVYSRHVLWDETVRLLRAAKTVGAGLVCLTADGEPLLEVTPTRDRDATRQVWRAILDRSGVRRLSYGKLRKTGAWMVKVAGGLEVSEMYLAHVEFGMNKHYAGRDWDKLDAALKVMRSQLAPMIADATVAVADAA